MNSTSLLTLHFSKKPLILLPASPSSPVSFAISRQEVAIRSMLTHNSEECGIKGKTHLYDIVRHVYVTQEQQQWLLCLCRLGTRLEQRGDLTRWRAACVSTANTTTYLLSTQAASQDLPSSLPHHLTVRLKECPSKHLEFRADWKSTGSSASCRLLSSSSRRWLPLSFFCCLIWSQERLCKRGRESEKAGVRVEVWSIVFGGRRVGLLLNL